MAKTKFFKLLVLPDVLEADSFYFIDNGEIAESYITDNNGVAKAIGNTAMITDVIGGTSTTSNSLQIVDSIIERDALALTENSFILVIDATSDTTVSVGSALYIWNNIITTFVKISEYESLDIALNWANLADKPTSTVANIDDAVTKKHTHLNKTQLDKIGENELGGLTYNGANLNYWETLNW